MTKNFTGDGLVCVRGERTVFTGLSFRLTSGSALVLVGPNGAGKSSLLRLMAGLLPCAAGVLAWNGVKVAQDPDAHRCRVRYVGHLDAVKPALTVFENLDVWSRLWGASSSSDAVSSALAELGIDQLADVPGRFLSAGQRRRLALARLLVGPAPLWLLDEPRTALDADATARLDRLVARHRHGGGMVVMALHGGTRPEGAEVLDVSIRPHGEAVAC
jgi:heme exporter protein A